MYILLFTISALPLVVLLLIFLWKVFIIKPNTLTSHYIEQINLFKNLNLAREAVFGALMGAQFQNIKYDEDSLQFSAIAPFSFFSWSENITVKLCVNGSKTKLEFKSICTLSTQIIDWGKNKRNAKRFLDHLDLT